MLTSVFAFALAICACAATNPGYDPQVQYTVVPTAAPRNLFAEVAEARSRIFALGGNDNLINGRLDGLMTKVDAVNSFRAEFENVLLASIEAGMDAQDARIRSIREQLVAQAPLIQDVDRLRARVDNLIADLVEIRDTRVSILSDIQALEDSDVSQNQQISDVEAQIQIQDARVADADYRVSANEVKTDEIYGNLLSVVNVINSEAATSFDVELTTENPQVNFEFDTPFVVSPGANWGITGFTLEDLPEPVPEGYGQYPTYSDESIYTQVNVEVNQSGGTASLVDTSAGWVVQRVNVRITVYYVDSTTLEYQGPTPSYS